MNLNNFDSILLELKESLFKSRSIVLHAPPGAGKTTRVPLILLDLIPVEKGRIVMLEPRRIAAVSAARWMAKTLGEEAGQTVGYSIRFESRTSEKTRIEVVTEGILTRRIQSDPELEGVAMVIFDEFHERSIHADLALSLCLDLRRGLREDLKIIVMSATLDCGPVAALLGDVPVITSEGRIFPVEERYITDGKDRPLTERIVTTVRTSLNETSGDVLVFLPGAGEIRACSEALRPFVEKSDRITLHPLYGDLPFDEQERAILPSKNRKIVLATNIAETSLTIEGVQVVIDSGLTRMLRHDPASGMNRLITSPVSRASAGQRKGRAGRLGPGVCYRLYSRHTFQAMAAFSPPEILVSDLSSLVLELAVWGVRDPSELLWLDAPPETAWNAAFRLLIDLGAIDPAGSVTPAGRRMARLPLHPRLARLMQRAGELGCPDLGADLAAVLSERDILKRGASGHIGYAKEADISDRIDILRKWRKGKIAPDVADPWALRTVEKISKQLTRLMAGAGIPSSGAPDDPDMIPRLLLCAFPDRVAKLREEGEGRFLLDQGKGVRLSPLSSLIKSPFIIAVNVDAGNKREGFVRLAAPVEEEIIRQECGGRIEKMRRVEWDKKDARIIAVVEERLGAIALSSKPFNPSDEEAAPFLREAIQSASSGMLNFNKEVRQFQGRVALMKRLFPEEDWPDFSDESLTSSAGEWLIPWLGGVRTAQDIRNFDILPALRLKFSWGQKRFLDERMPISFVVPSGSRVMIDYASGYIPVLAVKLQEMFGLADTPVIADGRVKLLLHLLSPARRPVQITRDLKGFWNSGYQLVRRELKGRYPKHPWPDDPWNATPTKKTKPRKS